MSAPTVDLLHDHRDVTNRIDHIEHAIDPISAVAVAIGVLACAGWGIAISTVYFRCQSGTITITVVAAAVITLCSAMCWCTAAIRHYNRRVALVMCERLNELCALHRHHHDTASTADSADVDSEMRAYIAGRLDRDEGH